MKGEVLSSRLHDRLSWQHSLYEFAIALQGKGKAAVEELAEAQKELTAPEAAEVSAPKKGRGRPAKAAKVPELSTPKQAAKRSR